MKILIAVHGYPPTHYAGAERAAERIVHWLVEHGHEVEVFAVEKLDAPEFEVKTSQQDGHTIHRISYNVKADQRQFQNLYDYPPIGEALRQVMAARSFDLVHLMSGYLLAGQVIHTAHQLGVPVVLTLTEYWFMCTRLNLLQPDDTLCIGPESDAKCARCLSEERRRYRLPAEYTPSLANTFWSITGATSLHRGQIDIVAQRRELLRDALHSVDVVISPSQFLISKFNEFEYNTKQFVLIRHGLNLPTVEKRTRDHQGKLRLGYVGQIKAHKGVDLLIDATIDLLDKGHQLTLDLWGPEDEAPKYTTGLHHRTRNYPDIRWNGRYEGSQVWEILSSFDALAVPSRWYENSPTVILEAYNIGLPVIATRLGGMAEMVEHEKSGLLFELNNADDLRQQIERLLTEPNLLSQLAVGVPPIRTASQEVEDIFAQYERLLAR